MLCSICLLYTSTIGVYTTPESGSITIPLTEVGNYTIYERVSPEYHQMCIRDRVSSDRPELRILSAPTGRLPRVWDWPQD